MTDIVTDMDLWHNTNWFVVQAKAQREALAAGSVAHLGVEVFLPKVKQEQLVGGVVRIVTKPLFPGYLFARFCPFSFLDPVRYARGVFRILSSGGLPIPLDAGLIESIWTRLQPDGFIRPEYEPLRPGDRVTIEYGPFAGWIGQVERELNDGRRVLILLEAIQQARLLMERKHLELVA